MILGIDHVLIAVENLEEAIQAYRKLGFEVIRGGEHPQAGTHNALVPLVDGAYLELIAIKDSSKAQSSPRWLRLTDALARKNRLAAFALESNDLDSDVAAIRQRGLEISDPVAGERLRPDGIRVAWRTAHCTNDALPFLIQDETPRELRIAPPQEGIGRWLRMGNVWQSSTSPDEDAETYLRLTGILHTSREIRFARGGIELDDGEANELTELVLLSDNMQDIAREWNVRLVQHSFFSIETLGAGIIVMPA